MRLRNDIKRQVFKWRGAYLMTFALNFIVEILVFVFAFFLTTTLMDALLYFQILIRQALFILMAGFLAYKTLKAAKEFFYRARIKNFLRLLVFKEPALSKYIGPAISFILKPDHQNKDASKIFINEHLIQTLKKIKKINKIRFSPFDFEKFKFNLIGALFLGLCFACAWLIKPLSAQRMVLPFSGSEFENILTISPGDAVIVEGKRVLIKASWDKNLSIVPVLQIKEKAGGWISVNWDKRDLSSRQYNISRLKNEIRYRLKYRSMKSRTYHLKMRNYPQFKDIRFSVKSPAYLKTANKIYSYIPARLKVLEGSEIIIKAKADKRASKIILHSKSASNNKKINFQKNNKNDFVMVLEAYEAMNLEFEIIADDSLANPQKILQQLNIIKDKPPIADILSPLFEVEMPSGGGIKIVYHLKDDFGLSSARLRSEIRFKGKRDRSYDSLRELHDFKGKNIKEFVGDTYVFFPKFRSDARAYFYLRVFDSFPSATGFRWTESLPVKVKIKNFYKNHIEAMDALDKMKHNFTEMLKEEEKAATNLVRSSSSFKTSNFTKRWQKFKNNSAKALSSLKADPYFNAGLKNEYEMLHEDIMYMAQVRAKNIIREFQGGTLKKAVAAQKSMPSFLKRGLKTMKKIMNNQAAKDFEFKAEDWENSLSKIDKALSQAVKGKADKKLWADLSEIMKSLAGEIGAMSKILERQKYKDSFGEKKRFQIPINKASSLAGKLQEALKNRNLKEALSAAKALLEEIRKTSRVFSEYSDFMASRQGGEKLKKLKKIKELWADLRDKEQETFTKNTAFTDTLVGGINIKRKKVLERLRASAAKIIKIASNPVLKSNLPTIKFSNTKMEGIKNILEWRASLESNIEILKKTEPQSKYPNIKELMSEINFNIALSSGIENDLRFFDLKDKAFFIASADNQERIIKDGYKLKTEIEKAREDFLKFSIKAGKYLSSASKAMETAVLALRVYDMDKVLKYQLKALEELDSLGDMINKNMQKQKNMARSKRSASEGPKSFGTPNQRSAGGLNKSGVKLPKDGSYRPSKEIREKVMESLKESYPQKSKEAILDYLRKISE